jgi:hypothetical protein
VQNPNEESIDKNRRTTEECIVYRMAAIQWKLARMDNLEGLAGQKFLANFSLYHQRMNRDSQNLLKTLHAEQVPRFLEYSQEWRQAVLLRDFALRTGTPWHPADDGFVFSSELLDRPLPEIRSPGRIFSLENLCRNQ